MPIGKDSIKKRVAKTAPEAETTTEVVATEVAATETVKKPAEKKAAPKKPAAKKPATKKKDAPVAETPATTVMGNVAPETVEKVVGHAEKAPVEHVKIGQRMPTHLL